MTVTYIDHSGFLLETEDIYFLFDYYRGEIPPINPEKSLVVFVSHQHKDHFNPDIFRLIKEHSRIQYVVAKGIPLKRYFNQYGKQGIMLEEYITLLSENVSHELILTNGNKLEITTLKSTDEGVAYLLCYQGNNYYHAGDLNLWVWEGESKQYNDNMTKAYYKELDKLRGREIEAAFVPLDPRQEQDAYSGLKTFMEYTESKWVFPMHFWENYDIIPQFLGKYPEYREQIMIINKSGQVFEQKL